MHLTFFDTHLMSLLQTAQIHVSNFGLKHIILAKNDYLNDYYTYNVDGSDVHTVTRELPRLFFKDFLNNLYSFVPFYKLKYYASTHSLPLSKNRLQQADTFLCFKFTKIDFEVSLAYSALLKEIDSTKFLHSLADIRIDGFRHQSLPSHTLFKTPLIVNVLNNHESVVVKDHRLPGLDILSTVGTYINQDLETIFSEVQP